MKKLIAFVILLLFVFLSLNFIACSSDEDKDNPQIDRPQTPEDNLPEEAKSFVGYWLNQGDKGVDCLFFKDGMCWTMYLERYGFHTYSHRDSYWTYDASTKILATSVSDYQWQVTLSNTDAWSGLLLGSNQPQSFTKEKNKLKYMECILMNSSWVESPDSILVINNLIDESWSQNHCFSIAGTTIGVGSSITLYEDENTEDYTFKYAFRGGIYNVFMGEGIVTLKNPEYLTNSALVFTGDINKIMVRVLDE